MANLDFPLILVIAVFVTGLVWLLDIFFLKDRRLAKATAGNEIREPAYVEYSKSFFPVLAIVLVLRSFLYEPFQIPSGSMLPTLEVGDFILVNKFSYGLRLPVIGTKVLSVDDPQRGDVLVFKYPEDPKVNYIKRVIGEPGDHIRYENKQLTINGEVVPLEPEENQSSGWSVTELLKEQLADVSHEIYRDLRVDSPAREWVVPAGHYFVMGDNRDNSKDSRYWGYVPDELVVGKAVLVWMHWEKLLSLPSFANVGSIN